jgi:signal transduction histidine kinase
MFSSIDALRTWAAPAVGSLFLVLWLMAEVGRSHTAVSAAVLVAFAVAIALSRRWPVAALCTVMGILVLQVLTVLPPPESTTWPVYVALAIVAFFVSLEGGARTRWTAVALVLPASAAVAYLMVNPLSGQVARWTSWTGQADTSRNVTTSFATIALVGAGLYLGAWALGYALRVSMRELRALLLLRTTTEQLDDVELELTLTRERDRIARDVHDVLAHSLAVVIAQADGARFASATQPEVSDVALRAISDAARAALVDVSTLIEGLREEPGDYPQPGLADIPALVEHMSRTGMRVEVHHFGDAKAVTPAQQLAVYRIVQESLTNGLRHAGTSPVTRISFDWRGPGLALSVSSSGVGGPVEPGATGGHGIRGMRDRARLAGGWLTAGEVDDPPGFVVTAYIPTAPDRTAPSTALELAQ